VLPDSAAGFRVDSGEGRGGEGDGGVRRKEVINRKR